LDSTNQEYHSPIEADRRDGQDMADRMAKQGDDMRKEHEAKAREQAQGLIAKARAEIQQEREKAVQDLREQVADLAVLAASRIIGESLDAKKHRELVQRAMQEAETRA